MVELYKKFKDIGNALGFKRKTVECSYCWGENPSNFKYCQDCGNELKPTDSKTIKSEPDMMSLTELEDSLSSKTGEFLTIDEDDIIELPPVSIKKSIPKPEIIETQQKFKSDDAFTPPDINLTIPEPPVIKPIVEPPIEQDIEQKQVVKPIAVQVVEPVLKPEPVEKALSQSYELDIHDKRPTGEVSKIEKSLKTLSKSNTENIVPGVYDDLIEQSSYKSVKKTCRKCKSEIKGNFNFCGSCGTRYGEEDREGYRWQKTLCFSIADLPDIASSKCRLVIVNPDGTDGEVYNIKDDLALIGRTDGDIVLLDDTYISEKHARLFKKEGEYIIEDLGSLNGVYYKVQDELDVNDGDFIRIGSQLLRISIKSDIIPDKIFEKISGKINVWGSPTTGAKWSLMQILNDGSQGNVYQLPPGNDTVIGRQGTTISFPDDKFISGTHALLRPLDDKVILKDLESTNGTYIRIKQKHTLTDRSLVLMGSKLFRVELS